MAYLGFFVLYLANKSKHFNEIEIEIKKLLMSLNQTQKMIHLFFFGKMGLNAYFKKHIATIEIHNL